jgi:hypothetical protein
LGELVFTKIPGLLKPSSERRASARVQRFRLTRQDNFDMLPAFVRIAFLARPRQLNHAELPVRHVHRFMQFEQANGATIDDVLGEQLAALFEPATPALGRGILMTAQEM